MNSGAVIEALARIFHDAKIQQKDVAIGVYGQSVIVRKITVPMMTPGELDEQIHWEAEQHIPFDIKVMSIDYEVLRRRPEAGQMDLLLVAAKKDEINDYAAILQRGEAQAGRSSTSTPSPSRTSSSTSTGSRRTATIALLNVGAAVSSLNIVSKGVSAFTREITNGGQLHHRGDPARQLLVLVRAGRGLQARRRPDADRPAGGDRQIIDQACHGLAGEIQRSLDFYLATSGEPEISRIYVSGGSAYLAPLVQAIERRARVPVQLFDPMVEPRGRHQVRERGASCAPAAQLVVALGLSLRCDKEQRHMIRINLLPEKRGRRAAGAGAPCEAGRGSGSWSCSAPRSSRSSSASSSRRSKQDELAAGASRTTR